MVWINDHSYSHGTCQCSWGGVKDSGLGRSHSKFGFYECVNIKLLAWEPSRMADPWWQPYDEVATKAIRGSMRLLYGRGDQRTEALRESGIPLLRLTARALRAARK
jgi:succinate-semialdehyde dehydrogenase/glutarate-semialdehyde dehydrogenase